MPGGKFLRILSIQAGNIVCTVREHGSIFHLMEEALEVAPLVQKKPVNTDTTIAPLRTTAKLGTGCGLSLSRLFPNCDLISSEARVVSHPLVEELFAKKVYDGKQS